MSRNLAVILVCIPLATYEKASVTKLAVGVFRMAFRARKVFGSFEKRTPGLILREFSSIHVQTSSFVSIEKYGS